MQESTVSSPTVFFLPRWARISLAWFMFAVAFVSMWTAFRRFDWVEFLCFGFFYLIYIPRQNGEPPRAYFSKPRTMVSFALMIAIVSAALHTLYSLYREYFS